MRALWRLITSGRGATSIEYALIASLISIVLLAAIRGLGGAVGNTWENVSNVVG